MSGSILILSNIQETFFSRNKYNMLNSKSRANKYTLVQLKVSKIQKTKQTFKLSIKLPKTTSNIFTFKINLFI